MNVVTITNVKDNTLEFNLSIEGIGAADPTVRFVIKTENVNLTFIATQIEKTTWGVTIPALSFLKRTAYDYVIEVILDGYYFEALKGTIDVIGTHELYTTTPVNKSLEPIKKDEQSQGMTKNNSSGQSFTSDEIRALAQAEEKQASEENDNKDTDDKDDKDDKDVEKESENDDKKSDEDEQSVSNDKEDNKDDEEHSDLDDKDPDDENKSESKDDDNKKKKEGEKDIKESLRLKVFGTKLDSVVKRLKKGRTTSIEERYNNNHDAITPIVETDADKKVREILSEIKHSNKKVKGSVPFRKKDVVIY